MTDVACHFFSFSNGIDEKPWIEITLGMKIRPVHLMQMKTFCARMHTNDALIPLISRILLRFLSKENRLLHENIYWLHNSAPCGTSENRNDDPLFADTLLRQLELMSTRLSHCPWKKILRMIWLWNLKIRLKMIAIWTIIV